MPQKLEEILNGIDAGFLGAIKNCKLLLLWNQVVDERVQRQTEAVKIQYKTLHVSTSSPTWAHELNFLKRDIIKKFNQIAGEEAISDIRFKVRGI